MSDIDMRTGRPFGDHGTAMQAIEFALDKIHVERDTFLNSWREGDLDEWPEFYAWLAKQPSSSTGIDFQRIPPGTPVQKVGGYPFTGTVVAAFQTIAGNERFVVEATGAEYAGMLHIFNGGQLRAAEEVQTP